MTNQFEVRLPVFEGPFDLLLFFIERDELDIHNIPIAQITNEFLDYIHQLHAMNIELASEFILVASTLMRIKAKMLLPRYSTDEEGNELDPRYDLVKALLEYKQYKMAAEELKVMEEYRSQMFVRGNLDKEVAKIAVASDNSAFPGELHQLTLYKLIATYQKVMLRFEKSELELKHTVFQYPYTVDQQKDFITNLISRKHRVEFLELFAECQNKIHAVFTFLALLDMLQARTIRISIGEGFNNFVLSLPEEQAVLAN